MPEHKVSFKEFLESVPVTPPKPTSLVGALSRSSDPDSFLLDLGYGREIAVPVKAVDNYALLGSTVGQMIVRVDLKVDQLTQELRALFASASDPSPLSPYAVYPPGGLPITSHGIHDPIHYPKVRYDRPEPGFQAVAAYGTGFPDQSGFIDPMHPPKIKYDPPPQPFIAATPHQASAESVAAMQGLPYSPSVHYTGGDWDKRPAQDQTYPTQYGWHNDY